MPDPRKNADDAYAAFMSMPQSEWQGLLMSLCRGGVLEVEENKGFERAMKDRRKPGSLTPARHQDDYDPEPDYERPTKYDIGPDGEV